MGLCFPGLPGARPCSECPCWLLWNIPRTRFCVLSVGSGVTLGGFCCSERVCAWDGNAEPCPTVTSTVLPCWAASDVVLGCGAGSPGCSLRKCCHPRGRE